VEGSAGWDVQLGRGSEEGNGAMAYVSFGTGDAGTVLIIVTLFGSESVSHEVVWKPIGPGTWWSPRMTRLAQG
jgi:hypothetical protein